MGGAPPQAASAEDSFRAQVHSATDTIQNYAFALCVRPHVLDPERDLSHPVSVRKGTMLELAGEGVTAAGFSSTAG